MAHHWTTTASPSWTKLPFYPPVMAQVWMLKKKKSRGRGEIKSLQQTVKRSVLTQTRVQTALPQDYIRKWLDSICSICSIFTCLPTPPLQNQVATQTYWRVWMNSCVTTQGIYFNCLHCAVRPQPAISGQKDSCVFGLGCVFCWWFMKLPNMGIQLLINYTNSFALFLNKARPGHYGQEGTIRKLPPLESMDHSLLCLLVYYYNLV